MSPLPLHLSLVRAEPLLRAQTVGRGSEVAEQCNTELRHAAPMTALDEAVVSSGDFGMRDEVFFISVRPQF